MVKINQPTTHYAGVNKQPNFLGKMNTTCVGLMLGCFISVFLECGMKCFYLYRWVRWSGQHIF